MALSHAAHVNPGNNVVVGQSRMAARSVTEIWIDANFKETQLAKPRIGQPYQSMSTCTKDQEFSGRVSVLLLLLLVSQNRVLIEHGAVDDLSLL
jgi:multidrug resistance efflux pump